MGASAAWRMPHGQAAGGRDGPRLDGHARLQQRAAGRQEPRRADDLADADRPHGRAAARVWRTSDHRVLTYRDLMALERNPDVRAPSVSSTST